MNISDFDYDLPEGRIARFPLQERDMSRLLVWQSAHRRRAAEGVIPNRSVAECEGSTVSTEISETIFANIGSVLPADSLLVFNNTRVVRARLVMHRPTPENSPTPGARIEILCLEPADPADYERAFAARGSCEWLCMVGNLKKWKSGALEIPYIYGGAAHKLQALRTDESGAEQRVRFTWDTDLTFGQLLELLGRVPIPPYLGRDSETIDNTRYQTVYARIEGSVAAPTAGLHFTPELIARLKTEGIGIDEVTLHVGAGTFLPVKTENALDHPMHTEHFEVTLLALEHLIAKLGNIIAVGTTSVRTLESLAALAWRIGRNADGGLKEAPGVGDPEPERSIGQFESYEIPAEFNGRAALETLAAWMRARNLDKIAASTQIMITPSERFHFRIVDGIVTNFHQPKSTLLLLIAAFTGQRAHGGPGAKREQIPEWRLIYDYALEHGFRFLSYGDSSLLLR